MPQKVVSAAAQAASPYYMTIGLNALNHLGIGLYSNMPAVLSEAVANSWDADASTVSVDVGQDTVTITDDGHGMGLVAINGRFLLVGYERRKELGSKSRSGKREVMGRKGIGKLSLFSVAETIDVHTTDGKETHSLRLDSEAIRKSIEEGKAQYVPDRVAWDGGKLKHGTRLVLRRLKRDPVRSKQWLRQRLSRRFSIIEESPDFKILVDGEPLTVEDRGYFRNVDAIWYYGDQSKRYADLASRANLKTKRDGDFSFEHHTYRFTGWIGSVEETRNLQIGDDELNKIALLVRGKVAKEDILPEAGNTGVFTSYLVGEIHADFLDDPGLEDIATSSRQDFQQESDRYRALIAFLKDEVARIGTLWNADREKRGVDRALGFEPVKNWFENLPAPIQRQAKALFGRINQLPLDGSRTRLEVLKLGILGFERLRAAEALDKLDNVSPTALLALGEILGEMDDLEAGFYYQITAQRFQVIRKLEELVDEAAKERLIQEHLFDHMWLLDPNWERNTKTEFMEKKVETAYARLDKDVAKKHGDVGRIDIGYEAAGQRHVVVELKRSNVLLSYRDIIDQVTPYMDAIREILSETGAVSSTVDAFVVLGRFPREWSTANRQAAERALAGAGIQVRLYSQILDRAHHEYKDYTEARRRAGRIMDIIKQIDKLAAEAKGQAG